MTPADQHYVERRATPREVQEHDPKDYEGIVLGVICKCMLALTVAILALGGLIFL